MTLLDRMVSKIAVGDCWHWRGTLSQEGYGEISLGQKSQGKGPAHRVLYELIVEPVAPGLVLDHLCRNRGCVNPDHLEPVTNRENVLRGESMAAINARKTHCIRNHELAGDNLWINGQGQRQCRECRRIRQREYKARKRTAA